jgi:hypothetical protein
MPGPSNMVWTPGQLLASADVSEWLIPVRGLKTSATNRTSTSKTNDPDLILPLQGGSRYVFEFTIFYTCTAGNLSFNFAPPGAWTGHYSVIMYNTGGTLILEDHAFADGMGGGGSGANPCLTIDGIVVTTTSGNMPFSWASSVGTSTASLLSGSTAMAWKVA